MTFLRYFLPLALLGLAGCVPTSNASYNSAPPEFGARGGVGPAPGQTDAERQARKDYYRGPRGDEF